MFNWIFEDKGLRAAKKGLSDKIKNFSFESHYECNSSMIGVIAGLSGFRDYYIRKGFEGDWTRRHNQLPPIFKETEYYKDLYILIENNKERIEELIDSDDRDFEKFLKIHQKARNKASRLLFNTETDFSEDNKLTRTLNSQIKRDFESDTLSIQYEILKEYLE